MIDIGLKDILVFNGTMWRVFDRTGRCRIQLDSIRERIVTVWRANKELIYGAISLASLTFWCLWVVFQKDIDDSLVTTAANIFGAATGSAGTIIILLEVLVVVLAGRMIDRAIEKGMQKGIEEGLQKGREEGRGKGREEERELWVAWNNRRLEWEAEHPGVSFPEPPPSPNGSTSKP